MNMSHPPDGLLRDLMSAGIRGELLGPKDVDAMPTLTGAYLLILNLKHAVKLDRPRAATDPLQPGWYIYAGSARGPGGIRARLARHFRIDKPMHWHIDQLTGLKEVQMWASPVPEGDECEQVRQLTNSKHFRTACTGFGSTDCRQCEGHLLVWRGE